MRRQHVCWAGRVHVINRLRSQCCSHASCVVTGGIQQGAQRIGFTGCKQKLVCKREAAVMTTRSNFTSTDKTSEKLRALILKVVKNNRFVLNLFIWVFSEFGRRFQHDSHISPAP